ncbi:MAG: type II toxin-antitoxin system VapC family toxin [Actinobacteria bacterium]|nr:type II toxin-antitoxin system VapC family toxin [Actinomycetota bacterium]
MKERKIKSLENSTSYILDSYAVLAYFQKEKGSSTVKELLKKASQNQCMLYLCIITLGEVMYVIEKEKGLQPAQLALCRIKELPVEIIVAEEEVTLEAAHIKANYPISYADCFAAAAAKLYKGLLVTGDPEFKLLVNYVDIVWI